MGIYRSLVLYVWYTLATFESNPGQYIYIVQYMAIFLTCRTPLLGSWFLPTLTALLKSLLNWLERRLVFRRLWARFLPGLLYYRHGFKLDSLFHFFCIIFF